MVDFIYSDLNFTVAKTDESGKDIIAFITNFSKYDLFISFTDEFKDLGSFEVKHQTTLKIIDGKHERRLLAAFRSKKFEVKGILDGLEHTYDEIFEEALKENGLSENKYENCF